MSTHEHIRGVLTFALWPTGKVRDSEEGKTVFPVRCPNCPTFRWFIPDETVARAVPVAVLNDWLQHQFLDSIPKVRITISISNRVDLILQ